ncbi:MAG: hypothetical protein RL186_572, partial [Pseudomonadota bacterium]
MAGRAEDGVWEGADDSLDGGIVGVCGGGAFYGGA